MKNLLSKKTLFLLALGVFTLLLFWFFTTRQPANQPLPPSSSPYSPTSPPPQPENETTPSVTFNWESRTLPAPPADFAVYQISQNLINPSVVPQLLALTGLSATDQKIDNGNQLLYSTSQATLSVGFSPQYLNFTNRDPNPPSSLRPDPQTILSALPTQQCQLSLSSPQSGAFTLFDPFTGTKQDLPATTYFITQTLSGLQLLSASVDIGSITLDNTGVIRNITISGGCSSVTYVQKVPPIATINILESFAPTQAKLLPNFTSISDLKEFQFNSQISVTVKEIRLAYYNDPNLKTITPVYLLVTQYGSTQLFYYLPY